MAVKWVCVCKRLIRKITGLKPQAKRRAAAKQHHAVLTPRKGRAEGGKGRGAIRKEEVEYGGLKGKREV